MTLLAPVTIIEATKKGIFVLFTTTRLAYLLFLSVITWLAFLSIETPQKYWLVCSAFLFSLIFTGRTFAERILIIGVTCIVAAGLIFIAGFITATSLMIVYLCLITLGIQWFSSRDTQYRLPGFLMNVFIIIAAASTVSTSENIARTLCIVSGNLIVIISQCIFFLYRYKHRTFISWQITSLQQLRYLSDEIFACFTHAEYQDALYVFERRLHLQKIKVMQALSTLHQYTTSQGRRPATHPRDPDTMQKNTSMMLTQIFDLMLSLAMLRWRVTDLTIFRVCYKEMEDVADAIHQLFIHLHHQVKNKKVKVETYPLSQAINRLEENYQHVIRVTAREPLVFLLFINDLKELNKHIHDIAT